jgi:hypothetical protein
MQGHDAERDNKNHLTNERWTGAKMRRRNVVGDVGC